MIPSSKPPIPPRKKQDVPKEPPHQTNRPPLTPNYYSTKDFPNIPHDGWLKPCYYRNCLAITGERLQYKNVSIPCCRKCKRRPDALDYFIQCITDEKTSNDCNGK